MSKSVRFSHSARLVFYFPLSFLHNYNRVCRCVYRPLGVVATDKYLGRFAFPPLYFTTSSLSADLGKYHRACVQD